MLHHLFLTILGACQIDAGNCPVGCPKAFEELAGVACLARPQQFKDPRRVIVFLPGMMAPSAWFDLEKLAARAISKGYAVVALRGERGLCNWSTEAKEQLCFPSGRNQLPQVGDFLLRLGEALPEASRRIASPIQPPLVIGFSNGGFFAALLAAETKVQATAYVIVNGGLPAGVSAFPSDRAVPTLLLGAKEDAHQLPKMKALAEAMSRSKWANELSVRAGGHALGDEDIQRTLSFFEEVLNRPGGSLPQERWEPSVNRIDYTNPSQYLSLGEAAGDAEQIRRIASELPEGSSEDKLRSIAAWVSRNLAHVEKDAYRWRTASAAIGEKTYGGCADHALVYGMIARAAGIPTAWVKTLDADWIREFKSLNGNVSSWRGHVFLEVFIDGRWKLLDATNLVLYADYSPGARVLPGNRWAYDKGDDPKLLVLSTEWERWKQQTRDYLATFDLSGLPVGSGTELRNRAFIIADAPVWQWLSGRFSAAGLEPFSFNADFEKNLASAKGRWLVVTAIGNRVVLPERYWPSYLQLPEPELRRMLSGGKSGQREFRLKDSTRVTLVYAPDLDGMKAEVERVSTAAVPR